MDPLVERRLVRVREWLKPTEVTECIHTCFFSSERLCMISRAILSCRACASPEHAMVLVVLFLLVLLTVQSGEHLPACRVQGPVLSDTSSLWWCSSSRMMSSAVLLTCLPSPSPRFLNWNHWLQAGRGKINEL